MNKICEDCQDKCQHRDYPKTYNISRRLMSDFSYIKIDSDFFEFKGGFNKQPHWYKHLWRILETELPKCVKEQQARTKKNGNSGTKTKSYS